MSEEVKTKAKRSDEPVEFEVVERATAPKRSFPRASKWLKVIAAAVENEGKFVLVKKMGERPERSIMAALTGFAKRHPQLLAGKRLRTMTHTDNEGKTSGILVWATEAPEQKELPLKSETAAA